VRGPGTLASLLSLPLLDAKTTEITVSGQVQSPPSKLESERNLFKAVRPTSDNPSTSFPTIL
jgi:hypothetical protein